MTDRRTYTPSHFPAPVVVEHGGIWCADCPLTPRQALELVECIAEGRVYRTEDHAGPHYVPDIEGPDYAEVEGRPLSWDACQTLMQALTTAARAGLAASLEVAQLVEGRA